MVISFDSCPAAGRPTDFIDHGRTTNTCSDKTSGAQNARGLCLELNMQNAFFLFSVHPVFYLISEILLFMLCQRVSSPLSE